MVEERKDVEMMSNDREELFDFARQNLVDIVNDISYSDD